MINPEMRARVRRFEKNQTKWLGIPEWKILLALAYDGPQIMYEIAKKRGLKYPTVHRAIKGLRELDWLKVVKEQYSLKHVLTKTYGLTVEGLLWLLSRIPKTVDPTLVDRSSEDELGLRKAWDEKDIRDLRNLETQNDVYLHLLWYFDIASTAKNNTNLFPLIFENWNQFRKVGVADSLATIFPETAFSTLVEQKNCVITIRMNYG
jgi:DNA-binding Lrp family transcriptional regulator